MYCPACKSTRIKILCNLFDHLFRTTADKFSLCQCKACEIQFLFPVIPSKVSAHHYPDNYWVDPINQQKALLGKLLETYRRIALYTHVRFARQIARKQKRRNIPVRLLDVGCGDGLFLAESGIEPCIGLDISLQAVRTAKYRKVDAVQGSLLCYPFANHSFSLITMHHVLEHFSPATPYLNAARRLLIRDGDLIIQVPNANSYQARLFKELWAGYDAPRHLIHYTPKNLRRALSHSGFKIIRQTHFSMRDNAQMFAMSLAPGLYPPARTYAPNGSRTLITDLAFLGISIASLPFSLTESLLRHGATIMIHAKPA